MSTAPTTQWERDAARRREKIVKKIRNAVPDIDARFLHEQLPDAIRTADSTGGGGKIQHAADLVIEAWKPIAGLYGAISKFRGYREYDRERREREVIRNLEVSDEPQLYRPQDQDDTEALKAHRKALRAAQGAGVVEGWYAEAVQPHTGIEGLYLAGLDDVAETVLDAANTLTPKARETYLLHHNEGLDIDEIADRLGADQATIRKRLSRATIKVRAHPKVKALRNRSKRTTGRPKKERVADTPTINHEDNQNDTSTSSGRTSSAGSFPVAGTDGVDTMAAQEGRTQ